jgi:hypothetical protein
MAALFDEHEAHPPARFQASGFFWCFDFVARKVE